MLEELAYDADLAHAPTPEEYEVLDTNALAERLGLSRNTIFTYLNRKSYHRIPNPDRRLSTGPIWYELSIQDWERESKKIKPAGRPARNLPNITRHTPNITPKPNFQP